MEKRIIKVSSVEELISTLEKDYGPTWYEKVSLQITETAGQIEAVVKPIDNVDSRTAIEELTSIMKIKPTSLPDLSNIEQQYSNPIVSVNISEDKMEASIFIIPGFKRVLPTIDKIKQALFNSKIVYGIDEKAILSVIQEQKLFTEVVVAHGKQPVPSKD
ncbi:MAG: flagellar assembly protein A, partial [Pseudothermotoga sp.]